MTTIIDGSAGITFPSGSNPQAAPSKVLQVVNSALNSTFSTSSSNYVSTGLSASITPLFSTSKILVLINGECRIGVGASFHSTIYRNSSQVGGFSQNQQAGSGSIQYLDNGFSLNYLDSPATTSSTTYTLYSLVVGGGTSCSISPDSSTTTITLMEIAQ